MTRTLKGFVVSAILASGASLAAQSVPEIAFDSTADLLKTPVDGPSAVFVGEVGGVGQDSKGRIFVYTRTGHPYATLADNRTFQRGGSRLLVFDRTGKMTGEWGQDVYGFNAAIGLRIDPQDNVWAVDEVSSQVIKFDPDGRVALVLGRKPEVISVRPNPNPPGGGGGGGRGGGGLPGAGVPGTTFSRPQDVAWDKAGNSYIADGLGNNNRIVKVDKAGNFVKQWGSTGEADGQFRGVKALAFDAADNLYVADLGNKRIQIFDANGNYKSQFSGIGSPLTMCITNGPTQYLYISHSGDPDGMEDAYIQKVTLDGKVVGKFGSAGRLPKQFGLANSLDCRSENELLVGEMAVWRVQKIALKK